MAVAVNTPPLPSLNLPTPQQNKMEDRLEEAIHVLQRHAGGQGGPGLAEMHSLLSSGMGLAQSFGSAGLGMASRLHGLVRGALHRMGRGRRWPYMDERMTDLMN